MEHLKNRSCATRSVAMLMAVVAMVLAIMMASTSSVEAGISCQTVQNAMTPCLSYLTGKQVMPLQGCCDKVRGLYSATKSLRADRITACDCMQKSAKQLANVLKPANVEALPSKCGVNLGYTPSANINCKAIH